MNRSLIVDEGEAGVVRGVCDNRTNANIYSSLSQDNFELRSESEGFGDDNDEDYSEYYEEEDDYGEDYYVDNDEFQAELKAKNASPLIFKCYTTKALMDQMCLLSDHYSDVLKLSRFDTLTLLQSYLWNHEKLLDDYMEDPDKIKAKVGVSANASLGSRLNHYNDDEFLCLICCDNAVSTYQLDCQHEFCLDCYSRYIKDRLTTGKVITCPSCDLALATYDIDRIGGEGQSLKLLESSIKEYVERQKNFKWCPSPDCNEAIEILNLIEMPNIIKENQLPIATCNHGHQFCVSCSFENHSPTPCLVTKSWVTKCKDDSETVKWMVSNTKECPKCESSIEKNGGCNHMTCRKCTYEFCWICMESWVYHGDTQNYRCNRFKEKAQGKNQKKEDEAVSLARMSLKRYIHYYNHFTIHEQSTKQDIRRCAEVEDLVRELQESSGISWIEAQFVAESATSLSRARGVLKWSYTLAYACTNNSFLSIFETVQASLATAVEDLSKLFEIENPAEIVESKLVFLNKQSFLIDRQNALISCANEAVSNGYISYQL